MHNYTLISGWLYAYICNWDSSKTSISISLSGNVVITIHVLPVCSGRPDLEMGHMRASPRHNQCTAAGKNVCNFITTFFTWEADWNFELVQMVFGTLGALSFIFTMENCCLGQVHFWACSNNVRHAWCAPSVFLHVGKFFVGAGGT